MDIPQGALLKSINSPADLKSLDRDQLQQVGDELRQYIIDDVSLHGGHFAASLGVVELTVALHHVFNTPYDQLVWDVGHQAYGHKILTGRRDNFSTNRKYKGLSGFPRRAKAYMIPLEWAILPLPSAQPWACPWQPSIRGKRTEKRLP